MSVKADSRLAEFLRRVAAGGDDAAPSDVIFGEGEVNDVQVSVAERFAASVHEMGLIEPSNGTDLSRVRVTPQGREWLDEYDGRAPTLHPRFTS